MRDNKGRFVKGYPLDIVRTRKVLHFTCPKCHKEFTSHRQQKYCNRTCALEVFKENARTVNIGRKLSLEHKNKLSEYGKIQMSNKDMLKKVLGKRGKSSLETKMEHLLNKEGFKFEFVGDGKFFISKKVPDFINKEDKIAIEVYYRRHKENLRNLDINQWKAERTELFAKEGWKTIFFDETEVISPIIIEKLNFGGNENYGYSKQERI
jgi:deoxyribodipyrimidine photolyase-like uncharacterized protein